MHRKVIQLPAQEQMLVHAVGSTAWSVLWGGSHLPP